jgi:hypothetical protein
MSFLRCWEIYKAILLVKWLSFLESSLMLAELQSVLPKWLCSAATVDIKSNCLSIRASVEYHFLVPVTTRETQALTNNSASSTLTRLWLIVANMLTNSLSNCKRHLNLFQLVRCLVPSFLLVTDISLTKWHQEIEWKLLVFWASWIEGSLTATQTSNSNKQFRLATLESSE